MSQIDYKERMGRPSAALLLLAAAGLVPGTARAQQDYAGVLLEYLSGDADAALKRVVTLDRQDIEAGVEAFNMTRSRQILAAAAAMHTEAAIRPQLGGVTNTYHLQVATAIVEFGEESKLKSNSRMSIHPQYATPVTENFRRLFYCSVITVLENGAKLPLA